MRNNKWLELEKLAIYRLPFLNHINRVIIAQWALESNWGKSELFTKYNNAAGMKWRPKRLRSVSAKPVAYHAHDGLDKYCEFDTIDDFILGFVDFLRFGPYDWDNIPMEDPQLFINHLNKNGYSTTRNYTDRVMEIYDIN